MLAIGMSAQYSKLTKHASMGTVAAHFKLIFAPLTLCLLFLPFLQAANFKYSDQVSSFFLSNLDVVFLSDELLLVNNFSCRYMLLCI